MPVALYPGTFDPITNGHADLVRRAARLFERVVVGVAADTGKATAFTVDERVALVRTVLNGVTNVEVVGFSGLTIGYAQSRGIQVVLRGLRAVSDFEFEFQLATMNRHLGRDVETLFLTPDENFTFISSSLVRQIVQLGGDVSKFVHPAVEAELRRKFGRK
jgi:pantetheine-phosphate adenylyltransferase